MNSNQIIPPETFQNDVLVWKSSLYRKKIMKVFKLLPVLYLFIASAACADALREAYDGFHRHIAIGDLAKAEYFAKKTLELGIERYGERHKNVAIFYGNLGIAYHDQDKLIDAENAYVMSLSIKEEVFGRSHLEVAIGLNNLASLYSTKGLYRKAEALERRALEIRQRVVGKNHPETANGLNNLATTLNFLGQYDEAQNLHQQALQIRLKTLGPDHVDTASSYDNLGTVLSNKGEYAESEKYYRLALQIDRKQKGPNHPDTLATLANLSVSLELQGFLTEAATIAQEILYKREEIFGEKHSSVATSLRNLASIRTNQGRYSDAEALEKKALEILAGILGEEHPDTLSVRSNLAVTHLFQGRFDAAEKIELEVLRIREKKLGSYHPDVALSLNNLASAYDEQGRYSDARKLYRRAFEIRQKALGISHPDTAISMNNLASSYWRFGKFNHAEDLYREALAKTREKLGSKHPLAADFLHNLSGILVEQGRFYEARVSADEALVIREVALGPHHPGVAHSLAQLASVYLDLGYGKEAQQAFRKAYQIFENAVGPTHPDIPYFINGIVLSLNKKSDFVEKKELILGAIKKAEKNYDDRHGIFSILYGQLAAIYLENSNYIQSEKYYKKAMTIDDSSYVHDYYRKATNLNNLSSVYYESGEYKKAEHFLRDALAITEKARGKIHPDTITMEFNLAALLIEQSRYAEAYAASRVGINSLRKRHDSVFSVSRNGLDRERKTARDIFLSHLDLALHRENGVSRGDAVSEAFEMAQLAQSSLAGKAIARMSERFAATSDALGQAIRKSQDLRNQVSAIDKALIDAIMAPPGRRNQEREANLRNRLDDLKSSLAETEQLISSQFPQYTELARPKALLPKEVQALLLPGEALIVINQSYEQDETHVFMVRDDAYSVHTVDMSAAAIKEAVNTLRKGVDLSSIGSLADLPSFDTVVSHNLYFDLLGPVEKSLSGVEHVFWVLDGALQSLPPGLLVTEKPFQVGNYTEVAWLTKRFASTTLPSVSSLKALRTYAKRSTARDPFIGFGDPKLEGSNGSNRGKIDYARLIRGFVAQPSVLKQSLSSLPDTADELRGIASALGASKDSIYLAEQATETRVRTTKLDKFKIVAFATHGLMAGEQAGLAEPALVLTPPEEATFEDDGLLSASEIAQLKLNADWVLLSACNTASGDASNAESLSGLAKAFFYAGSRSLLVSHWPVESSATVALITRMFRLIANDNSIGRSEALRQSKLSMISDKDNEHWAHPAFWAPFVVVGEGKKS